MNAAHFHLVLNHVPVLGVGLAVLLLGVAVIGRRDWLVRPVLGLLVFLALATVPVYLSGEGAEEIVEHRPGVSEAVIERHEESALVSLIAVQVLGLTAIIGLVVYRRRPSIPRGFATLALVVSVAAAASLAHTANSGGLIRHPEIGGRTVSHEAQRER